MKKEVINHLILILIFISLLSGVLAVAPGTCDIVERSECDNTIENGYIVMELSAETNAHGKVITESHYDYALCCNIGTGYITCSSNPDNTILFLNFITNAHAAIPSQENYFFSVCYEDFDCMGTTSQCGEDAAKNYPLGILSLSAETNAHIGRIDDYPIKICCGGEYIGAGECGLESAEWNIEESIEGQKVRLQVTGSGIECDGQSVAFEVIEGGLASQGPAQTQPLSVAFDGNTATGKWSAEWVDDLGTDPEYYFTAMLSHIPSINIESSDPKLIVTKQEEDYCASISFCADYISQEECESDSCNRAEESSIPEIDCEDENTFCGCVWNEETTGCEFGYLEVTQEDCGNAETGCGYGCTACYDSETEQNYCNLGATCPSGDEPISNEDEICDIGEGCSSSDCQDGDRDSCESPFYCLSGKCLSVEEIPFELGTCQVTQEIVSDCEEAPIGYKQLRITGTWTGEECGEACQKCENLEQELVVIPCPAQIQLPFFDYYQIIIAGIIIIIIYIILHKKKSKKKKKAKK